MMRLSKGPRRLTRAQVQRILAWHASLESWREKRSRVPTLSAFACENHMHPHTLLRLLPKLNRKIELLVRIREWDRAYRKLLKPLKPTMTLRDLVKECGTCETTVVSAIRRKGQYKAAPPESFAEIRLQRSARIERLKRQNLY